MHDRRQDIAAGDRVLIRLTCRSIRPAHNLPHLQSSTDECQRAEITPVVPATVLVDFWSATELTRNHQQYLFGREFRKP